MRWLYFPLAFAIPLFSLLMGRFMKWKSVVGIALASAIAIWLGMTSHLLNLNQWHDEDRFFHREVEQYNNLFYAGGLAEAYRNRKDYPNAERLYELALRHFPNNATDRINFADLLLQKRKPDEALAQLQKAKGLKMTPAERGMLHNNEGMAYVQLKMYEKAITPLEEAVKAIPTHPEFFANLGAAYGLVGKNDEAIKVLEKGLSIIPNSVSLKRNLAISYMKDGHHERAIQMLEGIPIHQRGQDSETGRLLKRARDQMNSSR
jgi:tetratricopeptide (TPR) repeat protein